ncbi:hypothetical protein TNCV_4492011 [Trichonephila clavipes]|nr:hypothetical protein TNCV_4492011 [Trichonephila clavipes]
MLWEWQEVLLQDGEISSKKLGMFNIRKDGLMVWAGNNTEERTALYIIQNGNLMTQRYADEILRPHLVIYAATNGDFFLEMQDNAKLHTVCLMNFLENETKQCMWWIACSLDLNPNEYIWNTIGRGFAA